MSRFERSPSVIATGLTRRFGDFVAVDAVSFEIKPGEIWGFLGPNGSGKSTTIRMLCGVLAPSAGSATVLGYDVARDPESVKLRIGYMSQGSSLWDDLTVEEHLRFYAGMFDLYGAAQREAVEAWMERVGLTERRNELAGALPGGFRKRLALACTLLHRPQILFLDEPTAGVDPVSRREFWEIIAGLADQGTTVMVSTHYMDEAEHCDHLALIFGGRIIARGSPRQLKESLSSGSIVQIVSPRSVELLDAIEKLPFVASCALFGTSLHVTLRRREDLELLVQALRERGFEELPEPAVPSLEDVFASLVSAA